MKKIEDAAREYCGGTEHDFKREIFLAGARYVLDAMTSHEAVKSASESKAKSDEGDFDALGDLIGFSGENANRIVILAALTAVRKEIEGE